MEDRKETQQKEIKGERRKDGKNTVMKGTKERMDSRDN